MIITKIETQKNKERVNIYLDGKFAFSISTEIKYKYNLKENMEIQEDFINKILMEEEQLRANNYALSYLSYRSRSKKEIVDKLKEKGFEDWIIQNCLDYLEGYGYVNDREFAKAFMRDKINMNKYGPQRIRYELYKKGISKEIIDKV
ncbi:MAG: hypothetical protein GXY88_01375 [Tissierellia bacterium]|nr:hypothetical protein [Tissierellia bacterium]